MRRIQVVGEFAQGQGAVRIRQAGREIVAAHSGSGLEGFPDDGQTRDLRVDLVEFGGEVRLKTGPGCPMFSPHHFEEVADLGQGETETLRGLDHPQRGDSGVGVGPVTTQRPIRLRQQAAAFVVLQRLEVDAGRLGDLAGP